MTSPPSPEPTRTVGCLGLLAIPLITMRVGLQLLFTPEGQGARALGPYRSTTSPDDEPRPFTSGANRALGAMLLGFTLVLPLALLARAVTLEPVGPWTVGHVVPAWVVSFLGHLAAMKVFQILEPHLPRR